MKLKETWKALRSSPVDTLFKWQNQRFLWILMAAAMGGLVFLAHAFFQVYLHMAPCEQCVYIRFAMLVMVAGGLIAAINPKIVVLKLTGCVLAFYGAITGIMYSLKLDKIHAVVHGSGDPFGVQGCSTEPNFPFDLPLAKWSAEWFKPTGDCGYDAPVVPAGATLDSVQRWFIDMYTASEGWYLIPSLKFLNMAQACFLAFGLTFAVLIVMVIVWGMKAARSKSITHRAT
ncbi:MAG: protein-disulfide oxidoreductase DsbI [Proteobacteria bacterium]|nr:protein-disulfide oxidoreductase DsbI [Pseudomonadota bacterium]MCL2308286.1 protein-disulfide oxidoreductase DsbI [Pseudomonadota bacterium]